MDDTTPPDGGQPKPARSPIADSRHLLQKVMRRKDLAGPEKYVLCALLSFTNARDGYACHPSLATLRTMTALDRSTIQRCIATLTKAGVIVEIDRSQRLGHNSNTYRIDPMKALDGPIEWKRRASKPTPRKKIEDPFTAGLSAKPSGSIPYVPSGSIRLDLADRPATPLADTSAGDPAGLSATKNVHPGEVQGEDDQCEMSNGGHTGGLPPGVKRNTFQEDARRDTRGGKLPVVMYRNFQRQTATEVLDAIIQPEPSPEAEYRYTDLLTDVLIRFLDDDPNPQRPEETPRAFLTHVISTHMLPDIASDYEQYVNDDPETAWRNVFVFALATTMKRVTDGKKPINRIRAQLSDLARHYERVAAGGFVEEDLINLWNDWMETPAGKGFLERERKRKGKK